MGYRQGLGHEEMEAKPTTCLVLTTEPSGFWEANRVGKWIERGSPMVTVRDLTHSQLELATFVQYELQEGSRRYEERKRKSAERIAQMFGKG
jgi:hypothetical protein